MNLIPRIQEINFITFKHELLPALELCIEESSIMFADKYANKVILEMLKVLSVLVKKKAFISLITWL